MRIFILLLLVIFEVAYSQSITVTSPNGGENWLVGSTQNITWTSSGVTNVKIEYSTNNGSTWASVIATTPASSGSYLWLVSNKLFSECRVKISDASNAGVSDASDGTFRIYTTESIGNGWIQQSSVTSNNLKSVYFIATTTGWAVGDYGKIIKTTDVGTTWFNQVIESVSGLESVQRNFVITC